MQGSEEGSVLQLEHKAEELHLQYSVSTASRGDREDRLPASGRKYVKPAPRPPPLPQVCRFDSDLDHEAMGNPAMV